MKVCEKCGIMYDKGTVNCPKCGLSNPINTNGETVGIFGGKSQSDKIKINDSISIDFKAPEGSKTVGVFVDDATNSQNDEIKINDSINIGIKAPEVNKTVGVFVDDVTNSHDDEIKINDSISIDIKAPKGNRTVGVFVDESANDSIPIIKKTEEDKSTPIPIGTANTSSNNSEATVAEFVGNEDKENDKTKAHFVGETAQTEINDIFIQGLQDEIHEDDDISIVKSNIITPAFSEEFEQKNKKPYAIFVAVEGANIGKVYTAHEGINTVGRSDNMTISLEKDSTVSRDTHCSIECKTNGSVLLKSGKSKGITYLENKPVFGECEVKDRDIINEEKNKLMTIKICNDNFVWDEGENS